MSTVSISNNVTPNKNFETNPSELKVVKLTPLNFQNVNFHQTTGEVLTNSGNVKRTYTCLRPKNKGLPRIEAETVDNKIIVHNYGHGGSGWTLLFGTVERALQKFRAVASTQLLPCDTKITIIGAGVIGLTTAISLYEKGYTNIEVVSEKLNDTPSYNAGGLFGIVSLEAGDEAAQKECEYLLLENYRRLVSIMEGKDPVFKKAVSKLYAYTGNEESVGPIYQNMGVDILVENGIIPPGEEVLADFGGKCVYKMIRYETLFVAPNIFMPELVRLCQERKISIKQGRINSFDEVKSSVIFNCTGLGAKELAKDDDMHPVAGHMLELQNQAPVGDRHYIIKTYFASTPVKTAEEKAKLPTIYYMPKGDGVVGGTFVPNYFGNNKEQNEKEFKAIIDRSRIMFGTFTPKPAL